MRYPNNINLTNRQINWLIAIVILISLGSFGVGYFWGEKKSSERFLQRMGREAFADQIYSSVCSLCDSDMEQQPEQNGESLEANGAEETVKEGEAVSKEIEKAMPKTAYYAQLVGFGTEKKAQQFVERLVKKGITTLVRERKSRTTRGKLISWYQVISEPYTDEGKLVELVERVKEEEHLHDVRIITI